MTSNNVVMASSNPNYGSVQTNVFTDRIEALPNSSICLLQFGESIDLDSYKAKIHTIRTNNQIDIVADLLIPLSEDIIGETRFTMPTANIIELEALRYGITVAISEDTNMNTPEDIMNGLSPLFSDYEMRLKEIICYNTLISANLAEHEFSFGGTNPRQVNVKDFAIASSKLELNGTAKVSYFKRATDQVGTMPVPKSFVFATSIEGATSVKLGLSADEFTEISSYAGIVDYALCSVGSIKRTNTEMVMSSEMKSGTPDERYGFLFGRQPFYKTGNTPMMSNLIYREALNQTHGSHIILEKATTFGTALSNHNRTMKLIFADNKS